MVSLSLSLSLSHSEHMKVLLRATKVVRRKWLVANNEMSERDRFGLNKLKGI